MSVTEKYKFSYEKEFKKLEYKDVRKLFHVGYYDGPLSGMCLLGGEKCWFDHLADYPDEHPEFYDDDNNDSWSDVPWSRRYLVWKLTPEQIENQEYNHSMFQQLVGVHTDYDENGKRPLGALRDSESMNKYYKEVSPTLVYLSMEPATEDMIVGWYEW